MIKKLKRIFAKETTYNDKVLILHIALIYAICSSCFIGISVWFKQPILLCRDHKTLKQTICNEDFACDNPKISFHIDHKKGHHSLAAELNLICHRKFYQRLLLSMIFLGGFLGCLINALIFVPPTKRKMALSFLCLIVVNAKLGVLMMHENIYFVGFFLSVISSACIIINSYCFALMNEVFSGEVSKIGTVIMTLFWGVFGIIFAFFCYYIDSNWKIIFWTVSLLLFFIAISLLVLENEKGVREASTKGPSNLMDFFRDIMKTKTDKNNFLICLLIWVSTSLTYNDILLELENVGQSLYINMSLIALIEVFASYIAGFIVLKFNIMNSIKKMLSISFVLYLGFYFAPNSSKNIGIFIVFLACKLLSETIYNLANIYTPKIVSDKYTVYFFIFTRLCSRILLLFLPHINHLFCFLKIHPFVFLSSIYGISRYLSDYVKEPIVHAVKSHSTQLKVEKELAELNFVTAN